MKRYPSMKPDEDESELCGWSRGCPVRRVDGNPNCSNCELDDRELHTREEAIKKLHEMGYVIDGVVNKPIIEEF